MAPVLLISWALLGIDAGWQSLPDGGVEYIIQIEPDIVESMTKDKREIVSEIPNFLKNVRSYRIRIGQEKLPHDIPPQDDGQGLPADQRAAVQASAANSAISGPPAETQAKGAADESSAAPTQPVDQESAAVTFARNSLSSDFAVAQANYLSEQPGAASSAKTDSGPAIRSPAITDSADQAAARFATGDNGVGQKVTALRPATNQITEPVATLLGIKLLGPVDLKSWPAPIFSALFLFLLAMNIFLGWVAWQARGRYRVLLHELKTNHASGLSAGPA